MISLSDFQFVYGRFVRRRTSGSHFEIIEYSISRLVQKGTVNAKTDGRAATFIAKYVFYLFYIFGS